MNPSSYPEEGASASGVEDDDLIALAQRIYGPIMAEKLAEILREPGGFATSVRKSWRHAVAHDQRMRSLASTTAADAASKKERDV